MNPPAQEAEHDFDLDYDPEPEADIATEAASQGKVVEIVLDDGRAVEFHVPRAREIRDLGDSSASVLAFCLKHADQSVECSGEVVLITPDNQVVELY
jgi:hypothetical protein